MSDINITIPGGTSKRLLTKGTRCEDDIVITAEGGGGTVPVPEDLSAELTEQEALLTELRTALEGKESGRPEYGFLNNTLTKIESDVTGVVGYACRGLSNITTVYLPEATSIGTYAFYNCTGITSFIAPKVKAINASALYNCSKLTSVNFPAATGIQGQSFCNCTGLVKADFASLSGIAAQAFLYCSALTALIIRQSSIVVTLSSANAFANTPISGGTGYIYVPKTLADGSDGVAAYQAATNWSSFQIRAIEDYPEITGG
jgi:hypothetical protein